MNLTKLVDPIVELATEAGKAILEVYASDFDVQAKDDQSPLTQADLASHHIIMKGLAELTPDLPIISEEAGLPEFDERGQWNPYWLIDPLDGTKEFVSRNGEFTVNIALIEDGRPVLGVVHLPVLDETYWTTGDGEAWRIRNSERARIRCRAPGDELVAVASRSHSNPETDEYLSRFPIKERISAGSSLKFCRIAEGVADIYPRIGRTMEWDIAAGHAVLTAAGGRVMTLDEVSLGYGKPGFDNPPIVARGLEQ